MSSYYTTEKNSTPPKPKSNGYGGCKTNPYVQVTTLTTAPEKSKKGRVLGVLNRWEKKVEDVTRKAEEFADGLKDHLKFSGSLSDAAVARLTQGAKMIAGGGPERVFQREFGVLASEKLRDVFVCCISISSVPISGILYISNLRIAFHSDYAVRLGANSLPAYYKVVMELEKICNLSTTQSEKQVHVATRDGFEFKFMGFVSYIDAYNCLNNALLTFP